MMGWPELIALGIGGTTLLALIAAAAMWLSVVLAVYLDSAMAAMRVPMSRVLLCLTVTYAVLFTGCASTIGVETCRCIEATLQMEQPDEEPEENEHDPRWSKDT